MNLPVDSLKAFVAGTGRGAQIEPRPGVVVVGAGKGGVGTSTIAALAAMAGAERGLRVLLVDADENVGAQALLFGLPPAGPGIGALRGGDVTPDELLVKVAPGLILLPGGGGEDLGTTASGVAHRRVLLARVSSLFDGFDMVVLDGGSRLESVLAACRTGAERLLAVTAPDRIALAAGYALFKVVRARFPGLPVEVVVNRATTSQGGDVFNVVRDAAAVFLETPVGFTGAVPSDPVLEEVVQSGRSLLPSSRALEALDAVRPWVTRLAPRSEASPIPLIRQG